MATEYQRVNMKTKDHVKQIKTQKTGTKVASMLF